MILDPAAAMINVDPGMAMAARITKPEPHTDFFVREETTVIKTFRNPVIIVRPGVVMQMGVVVVMVLFQIGARVFETWWNYFEEGGEELFHDLATQEAITFHFYGEKGKREKSTKVRNPLRGLFGTLAEDIPGMRRWTPADFEKAKERLFEQYRTPLELWEELGRQAQPQQAHKRN
jgi:hypothetical protein